MLSETIILATKMHNGQFDKANAPYILHPLRVMLQMETEEEMICAVLHDILEDTPVTAEGLKEMGYSDEIITAISCLTKKENEDYFDFIKRAKQNSIAKKVKKADLSDNMSLDRIKNKTEKDYQRLEKYKKALELLENNV